MKRFIIALALLFGAGSGAWAAAVTTSDTLSVADTLACEAGTAGTTIKKCSPQILSSQVVGTTYTTSVGGELACMDGTTGKLIKGCGYSALTTIAPRGMLMNTSTTLFGAPSVVFPTGSLPGVPVLNAGAISITGDPTITGHLIAAGQTDFTAGRVSHTNAGDPSNPTVLELDNLTPIAATTANVIQSAWKNAAGTLATRGVLAHESTALTTAAETGKWKLTNVTAGTSKYELWAANGIAIENSANPTTFGPGTLNVKTAYYCDGVVGVTCTAGGMNISTMTTKCGLVTHC